MLAHAAVGSRQVKRWVHSCPGRTLYLMRHIVNVKTVLHETSQALEKARTLQFLSSYHCPARATMSTRSLHIQRKILDRGPNGSSAAMRAMQICAGRSGASQGVDSQDGVTADEAPLHMWMGLS